MLPFEWEGRARWAHLPEAEPPAWLRESVLADWHRDYGRSSARIASTFASGAVAAAFVLAVALSSRTQPPAVVDPMVAILRAHGVEMLLSPTATRPSEVRRIVIGSAAARVGIRAGDRVLSIGEESAAGGMVNLAVLRGSSPRYFALPGSPAVTQNTSAGMAHSRAPPRLIFASA